MKTTFERWAENQGLEPEAEAAMAESVVCFKAGAYRASLVFAYIGFMLVVRDRIVRAAAPSDYDAKRWEDLLRKVRREEGWDQDTFDAIACKKPPVFALADNVRDQVTYWRARRNDCAHSKTNGIVPAHTESLWAFIESNLPKFAVIGSREGLLEKVGRYFDPTYTNPDADPTPLVLEIASSVELSELPEFFARVREKGTRKFPLGGTYDLPSFTRFISAALRTEERVVARAAALEIKRSEETLAGHLRSKPEDAALLQVEPELARRLVMVHLLQDAHWESYAALIRLGVLESGDLRDFHALGVRNSKGVVPSEAAAQTLYETGFGEVFDRVAFAEGRVDRFEWGNPNSDLIRWHLERYPLTPISVRGICQHFAGQPCSARPREMLDRFFAEHADRRERFWKLAAELKAELPISMIPSLASPGSAKADSKL